LLGTFLLRFQVERVDRHLDGPADEPHRGSS
jgi:hypothetical protein